MTTRKSFSERIPAHKVRAILPRTQHQAQMGVEEFHNVVRGALRSNRVSDDPFVHSEWHRVLDEAATLLSGSRQHASWADATAPARHGLFGLSVDEFSRHHMPGTSYNIYDATANAAAFVHKTILDLELDPDNVSHVRGASLRTRRTAHEPLTRQTLSELLAKKQHAESSGNSRRAGY